MGTGKIPVVGYPQRGQGGQGGKSGGTDGGPISRECQGEGKDRRGRRWGVLIANWNGAACVRGNTTRIHEGRHLRTRDRQGMRGSGNIRLATINIRSGREGGLEATLWVPRQGNIDVGVLQEKKLTDRIHARQGEGYSVWATEAESRHRGGI